MTVRIVHTDQSKKEYQRTLRIIQRNIEFRKKLNTQMFRGAYGGLMMGVF